MIAAPRIVQRLVPEFAPWTDGTPVVLQRVYAARGVCSPEQAELKLARLLPPDAMGGLMSAVALLADAISERRHIVIVGDFDCDGATGTAVAVRGLRLLGATRVSFRVPNRISHGYGLSAALVEDLVALEPDLVVTVDNGIACHAGIAAAKARGWRVLVTDHHLPGPTLPPADVIVNPNLDGDAFPSKALAGVGVMFYLLIALRRHLRDVGRLVGAEPDLASLLDLVAVGTVADLVPLDYNNRLLVAAGLKRIRNRQCQPGLLALAEIAGRDVTRLTATDIGFAIAPRLNAAGRLEDMALGIECLLAEDAGAAQRLAAALDAINAERRGLQQTMVDDAEGLVQELPLDAEALPTALVLFDEQWHPGVVGLVASRIKERVHRPTIACAPAEPGGEWLRGSARSIPGFHVRDALAQVDAREPGLIERFGGHAMAAGLTLRRDHLARFQQGFVAVADALIARDSLFAEVASDGALSAADLDRPLADALKLAGPWGQGFPEPVFDGVFQVREWRVLGGKHLKLSVAPIAGGAVVSAIHFGGWTGNDPPPRIRVAYQLEPDDFRGRRDVQLIVRHLEAA